MKYLFTLLLILFFYLQHSYAQNLVPNPSFDVYDTCPNTTGEIDKALGWSSFGESPDYFNSCASISSGASVPYNYFGYHLAASGNAYAGLYTYYNSNYREYIGGHLNESLSVGTEYNISFKITLGINDSIGLNVASNNLGVLLTNHKYSENQSIPILNNCQLNFSQIITNTDWITLSGSFVADSAYQYIVFGNFFDNSHTDTAHIGSGAPYGFHFTYYFIDDISLSLNTDGIQDINKSKFDFFPNPVNTILNIKGNNEGVLFYSVSNVLGKEVISGTRKDEANFSIGCSQLPDEIYFIKLQGTNTNYFSKFIVKH